MILSKAPSREQSTAVWNRSESQGRYTHYFFVIWAIERSGPSRINALHLKRNLKIKERLQGIEVQKWQNLVNLRNVITPYHTFTGSSNPRGAAQTWRSSCLIQSSGRGALWASALMGELVNHHWHVFHLKTRLGCRIHKNTRAQLVCTYGFGHQSRVSKPVGRAGQTCAFNCPCSEDFVWFELVS